MPTGVATARVLTGAASRFGRGTGAAQAAGTQQVLAPMPGKVVKILVKAGDEVKARQGLVVIEAMKMENELRSPKDGRVSDVLVTEGAPVEAGRLLVIVE
jgi:biotin carboxyl carrier protein